MMGALDAGLRSLGARVVDGVWKLGCATRFTGTLLARSAPALRRPQLLLDQVHFTGVLSLIIRNLPMMNNAPEGFELMNTELKRYCEQ